MFGEILVEKVTFQGHVPLSLIPVKGGSILQLNTPTANLPKMGVKIVIRKNLGIRKSYRAAVEAKLSRASRRIGICA